MNISPIAQNINFKGIIPKRFTKRKNEPDIPKYEDCYSPELKGLSVMVPVFGYRSYNNPKSIVINDRYKQVIIQQGKAFCPEDNKGYSGLVLLKNKKNKLVGLNFNEGELTSSYFDKKKEKAYQSLSYIEAMQDANFRRSHKFQDGSALEEEQFFGMDDVTYKKITTKPKGSTTYIKRNNNPKYKGEPFLRVTNKDVSKAITADFNEEQFEFSSIDEAKAYFLNEYGIKAELINLKQAHLLKSAIDEYAKLDYQGKGKKLFDGLEIGTCERKPDKNGELAVEYFTDDTEFDPNVDPNELDEEFFENYEAKILFNKNYDWENLEQNARESYLEGFHSEYSPHHAICHELAHYLHLQNSPKQFYLCSMIKPSKKEAALIKTVSEYAANNMDDFVAEYITGRLAGKNYLKQVDELYEKYKGPNLF